MFFVIGFERSCCLCIISFSWVRVLCCVVLCSAGYNHRPLGWELGLAQSACQFGGESRWSRRQSSAAEENHNGWKICLFRLLEWNSSSAFFGVVGFRNGVGRSSTWQLTTPSWKILKRSEKKKFASGSAISSALFLKTCVVFSFPPNATQQRQQTHKDKRHHREHGRACPHGCCFFFSRAEADAEAALVRRPRLPSRASFDYAVRPESEVAVKSEKKDAPTAFQAVCIFSTFFFTWEMSAPPLTGRSCRLCVLCVCVLWGAGRFKSVSRLALKRKRRHVVAWSRSPKADTAFPVCVRKYTWGAFADHHRYFFCDRILKGNTIFFPLSTRPCQIELSHTFVILKTNQVPF